MARLLAILSAIVLVAAACGDSDDSGSSSSDSPLAAAIAAEILEPDEDGSPATFDEGEADCIGAEVVNSFGESRLIELGVTADDGGDLETLELDEDEYRDVYKAFDSCVSDLGQQFMEDGFDLSAGDAKCMVDELGDDFLEEFFLLAFQDAEPSMQLISDITGAASECDVAIG